MKGKQAIDEDLSQLHNREVFTPVMLAKLTKEEKQKAMGSLIFLTKKEMAPSKPGYVPMAAHSVNIATKRKRLAQQYQLKRYSQQQ